MRVILDTQIWYLGVNDRFRAKAVSVAALKADFEGDCFGDLAG